MSPLLQWLTLPEWALVVKALLHSLWQGALAAVGLALVFRRVVNPGVRYRLALVALGVMFTVSLVTWGVLNAPQTNSLGVPQVADPVVTTPIAAGPVEKIVVTANRIQSQPAAQWTAWLALAWLLGASAMLGRASVKVAGAEQLRRSCQPLNDSHIAELVAEGRRAVKLTRQVRIAVTSQLTSPAVVGVLVPTLILPLSLLTTLTPEQLRFILLHELAHIRRGDYLANLFQLFAEALFFFNPAVWWLSHQIRREREACCDALAIELSGAPADYARTLVSVAETILHPPPTAAPAFGNEHESSSLTDRVHRVLVPGYRPSLRLTWRAMLTALAAGGTLLTLSAIGTRVTVAAILSPQQRMDQIAKKMAEYGEPPVAEDSSVDSWNPARTEISGRVRMADGTALPKIEWINFYHQRKNSSGVSSGRLDTNGTYSTLVSRGRFCVGLDVPDFAPVVTRLVEVTDTNRIENVDLVLTRGFDAVIEVTDGATGAPVTNAKLKTQFWIRGAGMGIGRGQQLTTDSAGRAVLPHCSDSVALTLSVSASGYGIVEQRIEQLEPQTVVRIRMVRGLSVSGRVLNQSDKAPVAGATVRLIYEKGVEEKRHEWTDESYVLAVTDAAGRFTVNQLRANTRYWLGVSAPGRESVILKPLTGNAGEQTVVLGPELIVRGRVIGKLDGLQIINKDYCLSRNYSEVFDGHSNGFQEWVPIHLANGVATFQFTNRIPGLVRLNGTGNRGFEDEREVTAPIDDWVVELPSAQASAAKALPKREVIFRFNHPSGVAPRGTVDVLVPDDVDPKHRTAHRAELEITNREVRAEITIGGQTQVEPKRTVGYWFKSSDYFTMSNGAGPVVVEIPLLPAGAIYAQARNADGTAAGGLFFGVRELKPAPERKNTGSIGTGSDSFSSDLPRKWVSGPLPLGGTYQITGWRGNSFCVSRPIKLTEANPDAEVELQFPAGKTFAGVVLDAGGQLVRDAQLEVSFTLPDNHGFGLKPTFTDERGAFRLEDTTPGVGEYSAQINAPGMMTERVKLDFSAQPQTIRLKRGHTLGGRVVEAGTGYAIPGVEVRAADFDSFKLPMVKTQTDEDGGFVFTTLGDVSYKFFVEDGQATNDKKFRADGNTNLTLTVKLYDWSKTKPKPPVTSVTNAAVADSPAKSFLTLPKPDAASRSSATNQGAALYTRTFKVDTNEFARALGIVGPVTPTNFIAAVREFFSSVGVDLETPGKSVFYGDRRGMLFVRATLTDLDIIEQALSVVNPPVLQVNIQAKFVEVPMSEGGTFLGNLGLVSTNLVSQPQSGGQFSTTTNLLTGILTPAQFKVVLRALEQPKGVEIISSPSLVTLSGRQAQIQMVNLKTIVTGSKAIVTNGVTTNVLQTAEMPFGPTLDVVPYVSADGYTVQMTLIPTVTEFLGYNKLDPALTNTAKEKLQSADVPLPHYRVRQAVTQASVWDGQTIVIGGITGEIVTRQADGSTTKTPDPKPQKKQLFVFITPTIIDPAGNRVHSDEEIPPARPAAPKQAPVFPGIPH